MSVTTLRFPKKARPRVVQRTNRVYAIAFDINTQVAKSVMGESWRSCYAIIERVLQEHGFSRTQESLYFGLPESNAVSCILAVKDLDDRYFWFGRVVKDLRMLRIDEDNDLLPALNNRLRLGQADVA